MRCAVVGASGYAGAELVTLLAGHPTAEIAALCSEGSAGARWEDLHPSRRHLFSAPLLPFDADALAGLDAVFLAWPHGESGAAAAALHGRVGTVINLSGDLRLPSAAAYRRWYRREHPAPDLLGRAAYGLPELFGDGLAGADLVACAGCYATAAQLAAAPALALGPLVEPAVAVTALSGTTGAGRKGDLALAFSEVSGNARAYRVGAHPHAPEIAAGLERHTGRGVTVSFVPHLVPMPRGILVTAILRLRGPIDADELLAAYRRAYAGAPFVRVLDARERLPEARDVVGTNFCDIAPIVDLDGGTIVVLAALDNLGKGAAGQAVQVMNRVLGLPETAGLHAAAPREVACHA